MQRLSVLEKERRNGNGQDELYEEYCAYINAERSKARNACRQMHLRIAYEEYCLRKAREESRKLSLTGERRSTLETRKHAQIIADLQRQMEQSAASDPDFWYVQKEDSLLQDLDDISSSRLVDVPYLKRARVQIETSLEAGIPVYLVGHLGSGKTQLAMECAENYTRRKLLQEKLAEELKGVKEEEQYAVFQEAYPSVMKEVKEADCRPYFIAGSYNLTAEDMFFEKTLKLAHAEGGESDQQQLSALLNGFMEFIRQNESRMKDWKPEEQLELMLAGWKTFSSLYIAENTGYGTVVEKIEKEVLKALQEGRPVIIDELNTIAMSNLIALNDILQHHAGQTAYITGIGPVTIQNGFCLIGTGNLSTGTVSYEGTNILNPAFQSRFTTVVYNYVPQNTIGDLKDQEEPDHNELFRLLITHLCDKDGTLSIPDAEETLNELFHLAELARMSQDIFEGKSSEQASDDMPILNEAVLSVRNLMHVLDHWNYGEEEDLSMALWNGFLSSVTNADDRNLLLALSARYGFFRDSDGWHVEARARGDGALSYDEIRTSAYHHIIRPLQKLSREDVICILNGEEPFRKSISGPLADKILIDSGSKENTESFVQADEALRHLEHSAMLLEKNAGNE